MSPPTPVSLWSALSIPKASPRQSNAEADENDDYVHDDVDHHVRRVVQLDLCEEEAVIPALASLGRHIGAKEPKVQSRDNDKEHHGRSVENGHVGFSRLPQRIPSAITACKRFPDVHGHEEDVGAGRQLEHDIDVSPLDTLVRDLDEQSQDYGARQEEAQQAYVGDVGLVKELDQHLAKPLEIDAEADPETVQVRTPLAPAGDHGAKLQSQQTFFIHWPRGICR